jgi:AcrR family transcriptional regulator
MPAPVVPKEEVLDRLTAAFRQHGYDGASLSRISEATGLGKASLYHYFSDGKKAMADAVLEWVGEQFSALVLDPLSTDEAPQVRLNKMILGINEFYRRGKASCVWDLFSIGNAGELFRPKIRMSLDLFRNALAEVAGSAGMEPAQANGRAMDAIIAIQGSLVLARATGDEAAFQHVLAELPGRLLAAA